MKAGNKDTYKCILCEKDVKDAQEHVKNEHRHHELGANKKRSLDPSYEDVFFDRDEDFKRIRADNFAKWLGLQLVNFNNTEGQNTMISSALVNEKSVALYRSVLMLNRISPFSITHQANEIDPSSSQVIDIERQIKKSSYPLINDRYGPFVELNDSIDEKLESLLHH
jgi:hypothetical protein